MKKIIITGSLFLLALSAKAQTTIYTGNGSLNDNRTVTLNGKSLHFSPFIGTGLFINSSGSVGIGTKTLTEKLTVAGNVQAKTGYFTTAPADNTTFGNNVNRVNQSLALTAGYASSSTTDTRTFHYMDMPKSDIDTGGSVVWLGIDNRNGYTRFRFRAAQDADSQFMLFDKGQVENFSVLDDGNQKVTLRMPKANSYVCIGTSSNTDGSDIYKLSVAGKVRAHEVKVYNTWADYVFEEDYNLKPLTEVEEFIAENGHLPNVPSAAEVEEKGIELGEMTKIQQEKIEELTLYLIQQQKENQELKKELNELKALVNKVIESNTNN